MKAFSIGSNYIGHQAADNIASVLFHNSKLKEIYLYNNNFRTAGMTKITKALQDISTLTAFSIGDNKSVNNVSEEAADLDHA